MPPGHPSGVSPSMREYLANESHFIVLDGALGTALESLGCDLNDPLWSGKTLLEDPMKIQEVEEMYLAAGARCLITATYQVTPESYIKHRGMTLEGGVELIRRAVDVAKKARSGFLSRCQAENTCFPSHQSGGRDEVVYLAGSVGPYGAFLADGSEYTGAYASLVDRSFFRSFHHSRLNTLVSCGVDVLAVETQGVFNELLSIVDLVEENWNWMEMWVSVVVAPGQQKCLPDGTPLKKVVETLNEHRCVIAIGVNCVPLLEAEGILRCIKKYSRKPLIVYPNSGEMYDAEKKTWAALDADHHAATLETEYAKWIAAGARLIGGCCRTGPSDIQKLSLAISQKVSCMT